MSGEWTIQVDPHTVWAAEWRRQVDATHGISAHGLHIARGVVRPNRPDESWGGEWKIQVDPPTERVVTGEWTVPRRSRETSPAQSGQFHVDARGLVSPVCGEWTIQVDPHTDGRSAISDTLFEDLF